MHHSCHSGYNRWTLLWSKGTQNIIIIIIILFFYAKSTYTIQIIIIVIHVCTTDRKNIHSSRTLEKRCHAFCVAIGCSPRCYFFLLFCLVLSSAGTLTLPSLLSYAATTYGQMVCIIFHFCGFFDYVALKCFFFCGTMTEPGTCQHNQQQHEQQYPCCFTSLSNCTKATDARPTTN